MDKPKRAVTCFVDIQFALDEGCLFTYPYGSASDVQWKGQLFLQDTDGFTYVITEVSHDQFKLQPVDFAGDMK